MDLINLLVYVLFTAMDIYIWIMIIGIAMSWLIAFNVINISNDGVRKLYDFLQRLIEPVLEPVRRVIPAIGGIDISPIIVIIGFQLIQRMIVELLYAV